MNSSIFWIAISLILPILVEKKKNPEPWLVLIAILFCQQIRREREAANYKRGPKKKAEQQPAGSRSSHRDRRLSTSSEDDSEGESSVHEEENDKESTPNHTPPKEVEKKVDKPTVPAPLATPPGCRAAAAAAGPRITSAFRTERPATNSTQQSSTVSANEEEEEEEEEEAEAEEEEGEDTTLDKVNKSEKILKPKEKEKEKDKDSNKNHERGEKKKEKEKDAGTKRKAEVLSDNGRGGVTISTTSLDRSRSPTSPMSPTAKVPRLAMPLQSPPEGKEPHVTLSISLSPNGEAVARPGLDWRGRSSRSLSQVFQINQQRFFIVNGMLIETVIDVGRTVGQTGAAVAAARRNHGHWKSTKQSNTSGTRLVACSSG